MNPKWIKLKHLMAPVDKMLFDRAISFDDYFALEDEMIKLAGFVDDKEYVDEIDKHWDIEEEDINKEVGADNSCEFIN